MMSALVVPTPEVERRVNAEVVLVPPMTKGPVIEVVKVGVAMVGDVENTKLVEVVPVAPVAEYPVILLKAVILADEALVPPLATGRTPVTPALRLS